MISQLFQLFFQFFEVVYALFDMADVFVQQGVHPVAAFFRPVFEMKQDADFVQRHVQRTAMPDEKQPFDMDVRIDTVVTAGSSGYRQQSFFFIVSDRFGC